MVALALIGGLALAGYGLARIRAARNENRTHVQKIFYS
jgi:hypothetical protein